ncbi:MAG: hypothetical protein IJT32_07580 [Lachnospiraceae bacterium]|nr:hypothetical protein [Lachnospiraceae bacterium]
MEERLRTLFDYQRFESDDALSRLIRDTEARYAGKLAHNEKRKGFSVVTEDRRKGFRLVKDDNRELSEDELSFVNAAGLLTKKKNPEDGADE